MAPPGSIVMWVEIDGHRYLYVQDDHGDLCDKPSERRYWRGCRCRGCREGHATGERDRALRRRLAGTP